MYYYIVLQPWQQDEKCDLTRVGDDVFESYYSGSDGAVILSE